MKRREIELGDREKLVEIYDELSAKHYESSDWSFFNHRISEFVSIIQKYNRKDWDIFARFIQISQQKLGIMCDNDKRTSIGLSTSVKYMEEFLKLAEIL